MPLSGWLTDGIGWQAPFYFYGNDRIKHSTRLDDAIIKAIYLYRCFWNDLVSLLGLVVLWKTVSSPYHYSQRTSLYRRILVTRSKLNSKFLYDPLACLLHIHARLRHHRGQFLPFLDFLFTYSFATELLQTSFQIRNRKGKLILVFELFVKKKLNGCYVWLEWIVGRRIGSSSSFSHDDYCANRWPIGWSPSSQQDSFNYISTKNFQLRRFRNGSHFLNGSHVQSCRLVIIYND